MNDIEVRFPGLLDAELNESERLRPLSASLTLNLYGSSEATITLPEDAPYIRIHDWVSLYTQNGFAGIFRVTNISRNFKRNLEITLLHGIDILSDSVWAEQDKFTGTMEQFLTKALNFQTHLINGVKPWVLGTCEDNSTSFTDKEMNYDRLSTLLEGLIEEGGDYYYEYNMSTFPWTLNVRRKSSVVWSEFRLSRNVTTANVTYNDADLCTRLIVSVNNKTTEERGDYSVPSETVYPDQSAHGLIPDSSKAPGSTAEVTSNETTIRTYDSESGQRNWGIVVKTADVDLQEIRQTWPSVDAWAANFMGLRSQPSVQIQIDGEELAQLSGDNWDELALGRNCRVCLPTYSPGYFNERVVSVTYPDLFSRPSHVTVSLANALPKFSESITRIADKADSAASSARSAGRYAASAEELTQWSQIVEYYGEALDGTGVMTLYRSGIEMDAATGLKIYSLSQGAQSLYSGISVNTEGIESLVTKTGVNSLGQGESLYSKITQTAEQIQSVVSQTGVVAEEFDPNKTYAKGDRVLYNGTPYKFTAAHTGPWTGTDVTSIGDLQSQITQNASEISVRVTNQQLSSALQGYLLISDFSTELGNTLDTKDGTLAAKVTTLINVQEGKSQVRINADQIFLDAAQTTSIGNVFFFTKGGSLWVKRIAEFGSDGGQIVTINNGTVNAPTLQVDSGGSLTFSPGSQSASPISINRAKAAAIVDSISKKNDLPEGQFGFHYTTVGNPNGADITFNIADTAFYTAAVSAAEIDGRDSVTVTSFTWNQPNVSDNPDKAHGKYYSISGSIQLGYQTGVDGQDNPVYTNIGNPIGTRPQEITGVYNDGWNAGNLAVTLYDSGWANGQRTIGTSGRISASGQPAEIRETIDLAGGVIGAYDSTENTLSFNIYDGTGDNSVDTGADVVAAVVPGTVTVTKGTYNAGTHLLPITASALPTVGTAAIPISGSLDVPISGQWKFGSDGTGSAASENAMFGVYSGTTKLFGSSVTLVPSSGLVQLKEGTNVLAMVSVPTEADADIDVVGPSWNNYTGDLPTNRIATFSPSIGEGDSVELNLLLTTVSTWDSNHVKPVYLKPGSSSADPVARIDIDASGLYSEAQNSVNVTKDTWSINYSGAASAEANSVVFRPSVGTGTTKTLSVQISNDGNTFSNHKLRIYAHDVSDGATAVARNRICSFLVDATSEYTSGTTDGFTVCKNSIGLNYTADQTVQPGSPITVYPVVRTSYSDSTPVNLTGKGIRISAAASSVTYTDDWGYGSTGNAEEPETYAYYQVLANGTRVKSTVIRMDNNTRGTTIVREYGGDTSPVIAQLDTPKVSSIVTSGNKIVLSSSEIGNNVEKQVTVTYSDGYSHPRTVYIDAHNVYEAGQGSGTITGPTWNDYTGDLPANRTATYSRGTETAATLRLFLTTESTWTNHTKTVYLKPGTASATEVAKIVIDASNEYSDGQRSVVIDTATLSNVVYNSSARSARATLTVSLDNGETKSFSNVDVSTPYQAGLDGESAVDSQRFTIRLTDNSGFNVNKYKNVDTSEIYLQGVHDAEPVFEPVARYVWAESNNGAIIFYKNSTGSTRWGTLEANTRVWLMQENAVDGRYYVKFESYNSGSGSFSEYLGYIPTQFVHDAMKSGLYPGGGWKEAPDEETTMYIYDSGGNYVTVYSSNSINSSVVGQLYPNTEVTCLSVSNDWAQIRVVSNGSSVKCYVQYSIHLQSTETSPSKYGSARGWKETPQAITITGYQIQEIRHSSGIYSSPLNVKMSNIRDNDMKEYTSTATQSTTYENIATSGDPGDFLNLVNTSSGLKYYAWHNSTTYSGDVGHKVKMTVSYSDGNTETVWISILSKATNNYNYIN